MLVASPAQLLEALRVYQLIRTDVLEEIQREPLPRSAERFARELIHSGLLSEYQAEEILHGRIHNLAFGKYRIRRRLGEGGVGRVFKAWDLRRGRDVALKILREEALARPEAVERFRREARAVLALDHPNVVRAFDSHLGEKSGYLVMEYLPGWDLRSVLAKTGPLAVADACDFARQAALGLQAVADRGLVHRDVKPANLLLTPERRVKVLDLGLVRTALKCTAGAKTTESGTITREGLPLGTLDYIAPEQCRSPRTVDARADIYSLGCTLYHLLAGEPPFPGNPLVKLHRHQTELPPPLRRKRPDVPPELAVALDRMTAKDPADRFACPADAAAALAPFCPTLANLARTG